MIHPEGFIMEGKYYHVCNLKKSLYGLKQAPRAWYKKISRYFETLGFSKCYSDSTLYVLNEGKELVLIILYVYDILIMINNIMIINECITKLKVEY